MAKQKKSRPRITACGRSGIRFSAGLVKQIVDKLGHIPERFSVELYVFLLKALSFRVGMQ